MRRIRSWLAWLRRRSRRATDPAPTTGPADRGGSIPLHGDRGATLASRARSLQARLNALMAGALVIGLLAAMLVWYYGEALRHTASPKAVPHSLNRDPGDAGPPPLGSLPAPHLTEAPASAPVSDAQSNASEVEQGHGATALLARLLRSRVPYERQSPHIGLAGAGLRLHRGALERQLSGGVYIGARAPGTQRVMATAQPPAGHAGVPFVEPARTDGRLRALLHPTVIAATHAQLLPQRRLLLAKGTFIDCTLETAIDSTLPGMTTCVTATDTFSADGAVVLLPRGTKLIGQTRGRVRQGMARVFVIWTQARTPSGVVVRLNSPATDSLGRSGLSGNVDRHFWQRFGAALLVSTLTGFVQSRIENAGGAVIIDPTASEDVLAQTLRGAQDIAPTIEIPNGQRIEVLVARDVDFTAVYELVVR